MVSIELGVTFGLIGLFFIILAGLVLRHTRTRINSIFGISVVGFAIAAFICSLSFFGLVDARFGLVGNIIMLVAPVGMLFAAKFILYGEDDWRSQTSIIFLLFYAIYTIYFSYWAFSSAQLTDALIVAWISVGIVLVYTIIEYFRVIKDLSGQEIRNNILFLIIGLAITTFGQFFSVASLVDSITLISVDLQFIGGLIINLGILIAGVAFTTIPKKIHIASRGQSSPQST